MLSAKKSTYGIDTPFVFCSRSICMYIYLFLLISLPERARSYDYTAPWNSLDDSIFANNTFQSSCQASSSFDPIGK